MDWKIVGAVAIVALILGIGVYFLTRQTPAAVTTGSGGGGSSTDSDLGARLGGALGTAAGALIQLGVDEANRGSQKNIAET